MGQTGLLDYDCAGLYLALVLFAYYGTRISRKAFLTGFIALFSAMVAWYVVDPITLFPILHVPGLYLTYIGGNSKEIRAPAAISALSAADVEAGTPEGTVISAIGISVSLFISVAVMTIVAVAGNAILSVLPESVIVALNYLLPALFGAMWVQRIMFDYKTAALTIPMVMVLRVLQVKGALRGFPGGGYAQILFAVLVGIFVSRKMNSAKSSEAAEKPPSNQWKAKEVLLRPGDGLKLNVYL